MDIPALATQLQQVQTAQAVQIAVLKKAMEIEAQGALALVEALPTVANLPPNLGNFVNTTA